MAFIPLKKDAGGFPVDSLVAERIGVPYEELTQERLEEYQTEAFKRTLRFAKERSDFYADLYRDVDPEGICGRGSGLSDEGLKKKIEAIRSGIRINQPDKADALDILAKVGGADIAAMCGVILAGAALHIPVILDGLISCVAGMVAYGIDSRTIDYMIPSHTSHEPGGSRALAFLGLRAPIDAGMALGEGTGGVMLLPMLDMALALYGGNHSFDDIGIDAYTPV